MKLPGEICPFPDGRHKLKVWQDKAAGTSGFVCVRCSKVFIWEGEEIVGWWDKKFNG